MNHGLHVAAFAAFAATALAIPGCSSDSAQADSTPPTFAGCAGAPTVLSSTSVQLNWAAAKDNDTTNARLTYEVYLAKSADAINFSSPPWTFASLDGAAVTSGKIDGLRPNTNYFFVCRARDKWLNEDQNANIVSATTQPDGASGNISFNSTLLPIILDTCAGECHVPGSAQAANLVLTASVAFQNLTKGTSTEGPKWPYVVPGKPEESFLWVKMCPNDATLCPDLATKAGWTPSDREEYMPPKSVGALRAEQYQLFRDWIAQGAQNN